MNRDRILERIGLVRKARFLQVYREHDELLRTNRTLRTDLEKSEGNLNHATMQAAINRRAMESMKMQAFCIGDKVAVTPRVLAILFSYAYGESDNLFSMLRRIREATHSPGCSLRVPVIKRLDPMKTTLPESFESSAFTTIDFEKVRLTNGVIVITHIMEEPTVGREWNIVPMKKWWVSDKKNPLA